MLKSPSGAHINPFYVRRVEKHRHFWKTELFYVRLVMQGSEDLDFERLSETDANSMVQQIQAVIDESLTLTTAYDEARQTGYEHGNSVGEEHGRNSGYSEGLQRARGEFWSYDAENESHRLDDYRVGYSQGKQDAEETQRNAYSDGYDCGYEEGSSYASEKASGAAEKLTQDISALRAMVETWRRRATRAEQEPQRTDVDLSIKDSNRADFKALKRALARRFHPDNCSGSDFEKNIRAEFFKELWSEVERVEKSAAAS